MLNDSTEWPKKYKLAIRVAYIASHTSGVSRLQWRDVHRGWIIKDRARKQKSPSGVHWQSSGTEFGGRSIPKVKAKITVHFFRFPVRNL